MTFLPLTKSTILPEEVPILFYSRDRDRFELGECYSAPLKTLWIEGEGFAGYGGYSHYMILKKPKK